MIEIKVNVEDNATPTMLALIKSLTGAQLAELNEVGARAAVNAATKYHREFDKASGWRGKRHLGGITSGEGSSFGSAVASGWHYQSADSGGAVIANNADHYAFKVTGGTITPKRVQFLTIPLIPEAKGYSGSASYQQSTGRRLFRPKGRHVLMEKTENGKARSVFALVKSVTMGPTPNALPPEDLLGQAFTEQFRRSLSEITGVSS